MLLLTTDGWIHETVERVRVVLGPLLATSLVVESAVVVDLTVPIRTVRDRGRDVLEYCMQTLKFLCI